ncbi:MAG: GNAT family N-acetyltransferase [Candidatus Krumholzibacteriota bacterium]|nr:GNAT family N-acetyltransferase [Candidatus Krumholzibacteriota bacterium]
MNIITGTLSRDQLSSTRDLLRQTAAASVTAPFAGFDPASEEGIEFASGVLSALVESGLVNICAAERGGKVEGLLLWEKLGWDTRILGRECARVILAGGKGTGTLIKHLLDRAEDEGITYITIRVADSNCPEGVGESDLVSVGFEKLERIVYLRAETDGKTPGWPVVPSVPGDRQQLIDLAGSSYSYDRFHIDPLISGGDADRLHREWMSGSIDGRADRILVTRGNEPDIAGYCACILPDRLTGGAGWIDMLAVSPERRKSGLGRSLVEGALEYFREEGVESAALCTQEMNLPALRLYGKTGFSVFAFADTYRWAKVG